VSFNTFGRVFRFTTWGESHGRAIGCVVDGCPPDLALSEGDIQPWLDSRRPLSALRPLLGRRDEGHHVDAGYKRLGIKAENAPSISVAPRR
jgi:chorismate synthase